MIYSAQISTANTYTKAAPKRTELKITRGLVYKIELNFPPGSAGLAGVMIFDGGFQVWPSTLGQWFTGDDILISFDDVYLKEAEPFLFSIDTYNEDDTYEHLVDVRIGLVSKDIFMARFLPHMSYKYFEQMLVRLQAAQAAAVAAQEAARKKTPYQVVFE